MKPKFKIGQKVVEPSCHNYLGVDEFLIITSVAKRRGKYIYNICYQNKKWNHVKGCFTCESNHLVENELRRPTLIERFTYYS